MFKWQDPLRHEHWKSSSIHKDIVDIFRFMFIVRYLYSHQYKCVIVIVYWSEYPDDVITVPAWPRGYFAMPVIERSLVRASTEKVCFQLLKHWSRSWLEWQAVCALFFFDYSPLGYSNIIFYSPTKILIAQSLCCDHNSYNS